jgi:hypothetical protein
MDVTRDSSRVQLEKTCFNAGKQRPRQGKVRMNQADFIHHVRINEYLSAEDPKGYRRRVAWFAVLGYAWMGACITAATAVALWALKQLSSGHVRPAWVFLLLGGVGLAWSSLHALWVRLDPTHDGQRLTPKDAPGLFKLLEQIRRKVKGPRLDEVWLDDRFNASISQAPRFGLMGAPVNRLRIGLPMMMALDVPRLSAVLAHEYGHLRGNHGRFTTWVYRTRMSWIRMNEHLADDDGVGAWLNRRFISWYVPRFLARSFALARQDEYEADRISARLVGAETAAAALVEIEVKSRWMAEQFWSRHWQAATEQTQAQGPHKALRHLLISPPESDFAREALRQALRQLSHVDDTHPVLKERLAALSVPATLPAWSVKGALGLLGTRADAWVQRFDQAWCRDQASSWKAHHQRQQQLQSRVRAWREQFDRLGVEELTLWAECERRLHSTVDVGALYEQILSRSPTHAAALQGLVSVRHDAPLPERLAWVERLWATSADHRTWAAGQAVGWLERPAPETAMDREGLKQWRQRLKDAQTQDDAVWEALSTPPWFTHFTTHALNELALDDVRTTLGWHASIERAWLVTRRLPEHSLRSAYLLFIDCPQLPDRHRPALCLQLIQQLDLPGPVLPLCADSDIPLANIERHAFGAIYPVHRT